MRKNQYRHQNGRYRSTRTQEMIAFLVFFLLLLAFCALLPTPEYEKAQSAISATGASPAQAQELPVHTTLTARVTQYGPTGHLTASGKVPYVGSVASSDRTIPFGTRVWIMGKVYTIEDRTAKWVHEKFSLPTFDIFSHDPKGMTVADVALLK